VTAAQRLPLLPLGGGPPRLCTSRDDWGAQRAEPERGAGAIQGRDNHGSSGNVVDSVGLFIDSVSHKPIPVLCTAQLQGYAMVTNGAAMRIGDPVWVNRRQPSPRFGHVRRTPQATT
jgi:hypothetical protein